MQGDVRWLIPAQATAEHELDDLGQVRAGYAHSRAQREEMECP